MKNLICTRINVFIKKIFIKEYRNYFYNLNLHICHSRFLRLSIHNDAAVKIAKVHSDFEAAGGKAAI